MRPSKDLHLRHKSFASAISRNDMIISEGLVWSATLAFKSGSRKPRRSRHYAATRPSSGCNSRWLSKELRFSFSFCRKILISKTYNLIGSTEYIAGSRLSGGCNSRCSFPPDSHGGQQEEGWWILAHRDLEFDLQIFLSSRLFRTRFSKPPHLMFDSPITHTKYLILVVRNLYLEVETTFSSLMYKSPSGQVAWNHHWSDHFTLHQIGSISTHAALTPNSLYVITVCLAL